MPSPKIVGIRNRQHFIKTILWKLLHSNISASKRLPNIFPHFILETYLQACKNSIPQVSSKLWVSLELRKLHRSVFRSHGGELCFMRHPLLFFCFRSSDCKTYVANFLLISCWFLDSVKATNSLFVLYQMFRGGSCQWFFWIKFVYYAQYEDIYKKSF